MLIFVKWELLQFIIRLLNRYQQITLMDKNFFLSQAQKKQILEVIFALKSNMSSESSHQ